MFTAFGITGIYLYVIILGLRGYPVVHVCNRSNFGEE